MAASRFHPRPEFDRHDFDKPSDKKVRDAWEAVLNHTRTSPPEGNNDDQKAWNDKLIDLRVDFYQLLGAAVGYDHTIDYIKNRFYKPQYYDNIELEQTLIRQGLGKIIPERGLKITLAE